MRTAFVTGSSRGIGKAIAKRFASEGYAVILHAKSQSDASKETLKEIRSLSPKTKIFYFDVTNPEPTKKNCLDILSEVGVVDVLVNNVGILRDRSFLKMSFEDWDEVMKTNLYGPFHITKCLLPAMVKNLYGRVINISSIVGQIGNYGQVNYAASKAGLIAFTKSLAKETARYNVLVNSVCPGLVDTDILKGIAKEHIDKLIEKIPLKRLALPDEVAGVVSFLASKDNSYITGEVININGGWI